LQLITNDHANIAELCQDIPRALPNGGVRSRERLFNELVGELRRHVEAEEESLYDALKDHDRTEHLVAELENEHEEIERRLSELGRVQDKGTRDWTLGFRDLATLVEGHFHREEHELLPVARKILGEDEVRELRHEFAEEKLEALRARRHRPWADLSSGVLMGALAGAAAGVLAFAAWRGRSGRGITATRRERRPSPAYAVTNRLTGLLRPDQRAVRQYAPQVPRDVAKRTRTPVQDISSRLRLPIATTYAIVASPRAAWAGALDQARWPRPQPHRGDHNEWPRQRERLTAGAVSP